MNCRDRYSPLSCYYDYRIDFLCAPLSHTSTETARSQDCKNRSLAKQQLETLPDAQDEDSIFSKNSSEKEADDSYSSEMNDELDVSTSATRAPKISEVPPNLYMPSLQSSEGSGLLQSGINFSKPSDIRKKMNEMALAEEMASPVRNRRSSSLAPESDGSRHSQAQKVNQLDDYSRRARSLSQQPGPRSNPASAFTQVGIHPSKSQGDELMKSRSEQESFSFDRQNTMRRQCLDRDQPSIPESREASDPSPKPCHSTDSDSSPKTSKLQYFNREQPYEYNNEFKQCSNQSPKSCRTSNSVPTQKTPNNESKQCSNQSPKSCRTSNSDPTHDCKFDKSSHLESQQYVYNLEAEQPSDLESLVDTSVSSIDPEVQYHTRSCNSTANTVETSTGDISSKHSSDSSSSEKSHCSESRIPYDYKISVEANDDSPTTAVYNLVGNSLKQGNGNGNHTREVHKDGVISNNKAEGREGAATPRSALLEKCGWAHHHRYARHRGANSSEFIVKPVVTPAARAVMPDPTNEVVKPVVRTPMPHEIVNKAVATNNGFQDEAKALLIELDQLRQWKINASVELRNLTQCAANHASEVELLKCEAARKDESHQEHISVLKSQMTAIASNYSEQQRTLDASNDEIRELEQALERTKAALLAREMALSTKNQEISDSHNEVKELKSELASMINAKSECTDKEEEDSRREMEEKIVELTKSNELLTKQSNDLEAQVKQLDEKNSEFCSDNANLRESLESKTEESKKLLDELESSNSALDAANEKYSSLQSKQECILAELESANQTIITRAEEISSLREQLSGYALLSDEVKDRSNREQELAKDNASLKLYLESKQAAYKELIMQMVDQQDELRASERRLRESRDESSELRIKLEQKEVLNNSMSTELSSIQSKLKEAEDLLADVRRENASLVESVHSQGKEIQGLREQLLARRDNDYEAAAMDGDLGEQVGELMSWKETALESMDATGKQLDDLMKQNQELREESLKWEQKFTSKSTIIDQLHASKMKKIEELEVAKVTLDEARKKSSYLEQDLSIKALEIAKLKQQLLAKTEEYESSLVQFKADASSGAVIQSNTISKLETEIASLTSKVDVLETKAEKQSGEIKTLQSELSEAEKDLAGALSEVDELETLHKHCREALQSTETELKSTTETCERLSSEIKVYQDKLEVADNDYISLRLRFDSYEKLSKELTESKNECEALKARVNELETQLSNEELAVINLEISRLKRVNNKLASEIKHLEYDIVDSKEFAEKKSKALAVSQAYCKELELTIKSQTGEEPSNLQGIITTLRDEVKVLTSELDISTRNLTTLNQSLEQDNLAKSEEIKRLLAEVSSHETKIHKLQDDIAAERGPRLEVLRQLESALREKEAQISQHQIDTKNASTEVDQVNARFVSLELLNETTTVERDCLKQWKHEAEGKLQILTTQIQDLTSRTTLLQTRCNEQESSIKEKEAHIKDLEQSVKSKKFAIARYEEEMISSSKAIADLKSKCTKMEAPNCESSCRKEVSELKLRIEALQLDKIELETKIKELKSQEESLTSQLIVVNEEKLSLAKSSLDMAEAYEEKIKGLADHVDQLITELEDQKCKNDKSQLAVKSLELALVAVEKQRKKLSESMKPTEVEV